MLNELISRHPALAPLAAELTAAVELMESTYRAGGKILVCGNGGSSADSDHIVGELMKGFLSLRPLSDGESAAFDGLCDDPAAFARGLQGAIPAISLTAQTAVLSAFANDVDPAMMYAQMTYGYGRPEDLLIAISTSGNSKSVVNAAIAARARGMSVVALTGARESRLSALATVTLRAPDTATYRIQEYHLPIYHFLCAELERRIFTPAK